MLLGSVHMKIVEMTIHGALLLKEQLTFLELLVQQTGTFALVVIYYMYYANIQENKTHSHI